MVQLAAERFITANNQHFHDLMPQTTDEFVNTLTEIQAVLISLKANNAVITHMCYVCLYSSLADLLTSEEMSLMNGTAVFGTWEPALSPSVSSTSCDSGHIT